MGLEQVIGEVRRDGEARAQKILDDAKAEADAILADAREKADAYGAQRLQQADKDQAQVEAQILSHAEFEGRKLALSAEAELRAELKATLLEGFAGLDAKVRKGHVTKLLATAKQVIGAGTVYGAAADEAALKAQKTFTYGGALKIAGGIVVEAEDGATRLDLSYETLLGDLWRDILRAEAELFG